jgi:putative cell wall-binding protein
MSKRGLKKKKRSFTGLFASRVTGVSMLVALFVATSLGSLQTQDQKNSGASAAVSASLLASTSTSQTAPELPLYFIKNEGQLDEDVSFSTSIGSTNFFFVPSGIQFTSLAKQDGQEGTWTTAIDFVGAHTDILPVASKKTDAVVSYFRGSADQWHTGVSTASEIRYQNLWDGIDLVISSSAGALKYEFVVAPGADPSLINMRYQGAALRLDQGKLLAETPGATYVDHAPTAYQESNNAQQAIAVEFALENSQVVTFATGEYNRSLPLVIDPIIVSYASYFGGSGTEDNGEIQIDAAGNIYTSGRTLSADTYTGLPGFDTTYAGGGVFDGHVSKWAPGGTSILWGAYIGGTKEDSVFGMAIDADGDVYATGTTSSTTGEGFPATGGAYDTTYNDTTGQDSYVCKIDTGGLILRYCTYFGGTNPDFAFDIAVDSLERPYITGMTQTSVAEGFPVLTGPDITFNGTATTGDHDVFVARFSADGSALSYAGYIGGAGGTTIEGFRTESGEGIVVDASFNAYVTGTTTSSQATFPDGDGFGAVPGYDQTNAGSGDGFIAKVSPTGATLLGASYIGGTGNDKLYTNHLTPAGELLILGDTTSTQATGFPVAGGFDATHNGAIDTVVVRVNAAITSLLQSGFYGGSGDDFAGESCKSITMDSDDNIYITGWTESTEATFPVLDGPDLSYNGDILDGFIAKFTDAGTPVYSGYIGGELDDYACGIAIDSDGAAWTGISTGSSITFPNGYGFYSIPGFDQSYGGNYDASIVRVSEVPAGVTVVESGGSTDISEIGPTSDDYTVVLESQPQFNVTVTVAPNAQQTTDKTTLTFTPINWDIPQLVNTTAVQDGVAECPHTGLIAHSAASADLNYDGIAVAGVTTHIQDQPCTAAGIVVTESGGSTDISEIGPTSDTYTVVLTSAPSDNVLVGVFPNTQQSTSASVLTFTPSNWSIPQQVTTTAVVDDIVECDHNGLIQHTAGSNDPIYNNMAVASVVPHITDGCRRISGSTPSEQSVAVSVDRFDDHTAPAALISRDNLLSDAFTGIPFASMANAPILLTATDTLYDSIKNELGRVLADPHDPIYILGREAAIGPSVYDALRAAGFDNLITIGGIHRRETAAKIARHIVATQGIATRAIITEDERLVDAFGSGAVAGLLGSDNIVDPIVLNVRGSNKIDPYTDAFLKSTPSITTLELIGAESALPLSLEGLFAQRYKNIKKVNRTGGDDRFDTNAKIAERFFPSPGPTGIVVANGERQFIPGALSVQSVQSEPLFAALLAGTVAADEGFPLIIVRFNSVPAPIITYLVAHESTINNLIIVGDTTQVTKAVEDLIKSFI